MTFGRLEIGRDLALLRLNGRGHFTDGHLRRRLADLQRDFHTTHLTALEDDIRHPGLEPQDVRRSNKDAMSIA